MFETFAQAATSTSPNATNTGENTTSSSAVNGFGDACGRTSARTSICFSMIPAQERREDRRRVHGGDARPQPYRDFGFARLARARPMRGPQRRGRHEHIPRKVAEADERRRQDADDRVGAAVEIDRAADRRRIAAEQARPCRVAQDHGVGAVVRVATDESATDLHRRPERFKIVGRDERGAKRLAARGDVARVLADDRAEQIGPPAQLVVVAPAKALSAALRARARRAGAGCSGRGSRTAAARRR